MSPLFEPWHLDGLHLPNRIVIAPMCQYSADGEGSATDWHLIHLGHLALSGAGMMIVEATAVCARGTHFGAGPRPVLRRRTRPRWPGCWPRCAPIRRWHWPSSSRTRAARGRAELPWDGGKQIRPGRARRLEDRSPQRGAARATARTPPMALDRDGLKRVRDEFVAATRRAARLGFDGIEVHGAHGYLLHQFLSPLANKRDDEYGGSLENRMRFPLEVFDAVRAAFPAGKPVWMRISATDWVPGGWDIEGTVALSQALKARGCAAIHVTTRRRLARSRPSSWARATRCPMRSG